MAIRRPIRRYNRHEVWISERDDFLTKELLQAIDEDNAGRVAALIRAGADYEANNPDTESNLYFFAVSSNSRELVETLAQKPIPVNIKDEFDRTPLYWAVDAAKIEVTAALLECRADPNLKCNTKKTGSPYRRTPFDIEGNNRTTLHAAAEKGDPEIVELLLQHNAKVNAVDGNKNTPLMAAVQKVDLLKIGVKEDGMDMINDEHDRPVEITQWVKYKYDPVVKGKYIESIKLLLAAGARPEMINCNGLNAAGLSRDTEVLALLSGTQLPGKNEKVLEELQCMFSK